jgi:aspartate dehydrogenase
MPPKHKCISILSKNAVPIVSLSELPSTSDIVVECTSRKAFRNAVELAIDAGRTVIAATVGGLLQHPDLIERAQQTGARFLVPTGGLLGFDAVRGACHRRRHHPLGQTAHP